jgi:succinylglutamate desuccinylase
MENVFRNELNMTNIKVIEIDSKNPGKTLVILAGVHGNERCGVAAFNKLIPNLKINAGKVFFIYANLKAIKQNKRFIEQNLNRCFLKKQSCLIANSLEGKTAKEIMPYLKKADLMLDIHASFTKNSVPFVICDKKWIKDASLFNSKLVTFNWDKFEKGSTDYFMNLQNKPGFCFECGYLKEPRIEEKAKKAIIKFLIYCKCIKGKIKLKKAQQVIKIIKLYKNKKGIFKKARVFADFEILNKKTLIGKDGKESVYEKANRMTLFVRDSSKLNEECFLVAKKVQAKINKTPRII